MDKKVLLQDLADGIARRRDIPKKDAEVFLRAAFDVIGEFLQTDKMVKVRGLGTFKLVTVDSRESVDVNTGERITIKEYTKVNFTPDPVLRDAVNKPFAQFETVVLYESTKLEDMERMDMPDWTEEETPENETGQILVEGDETETVAPSGVKKEEDDIAFLPEGAVDEVPIESASIEEGDDPRIDGEETQDVQDDVPDNVQEEVDVTGDGSDTLGLVAGEMEQEPEETAEARLAHSLIDALSFCQNTFTVVRLLDLNESKRKTIYKTSDVRTKLIFCVFILTSKFRGHMPVVVFGIFKINKFRAAVR